MDPDFPANQIFAPEQVDQILDKSQTDDSKLSYVDYRYYVPYDETDVDFVPLGYWSGKAGDTFAVKDRTYQTALNDAGEVMGTLIYAEEGNAGWYYINSAGIEYYQNPLLSTAKHYVGLRPDSFNEEYRRIDFADPANLEEWHAPEASGSGYRPIQFYSDEDHLLRCFYNRYEGDRCQTDFVYRKAENGLIRSQVLRNFVKAICKTGEQIFSGARYSVVRFSHPDFQSDKLLACGWTEEEDQVIESLAQTYSGGTSDGETRGAEVLYNYGLTGSTSMRTGFRAFTDLLMPSEEGRENKVVILFSDGADTDELGTGKDDQGFSALDYASQLKDDGYTILTVFLKAAPEGDEEAEKLLREIASVAPDGTPLFWTLYGNGEEDTEEAAREILQQLQ